MSTFNDECMREKNLSLLLGGDSTTATFHVFLHASYSSFSPYFSRIHMNTVVSKMWCFFLWRYSSSPTSLTFVIFCFLVSLRECQAQPSVKYPFSRNWTTLMWFSFWTWYMPTKTFSWFLSTWTWTWKNTWMISLATMMTGQGYQKTCQR